MLYCVKRDITRFTVDCYCKFQFFCFCIKSLLRLISSSLQHVKCFLMGFKPPYPIWQAFMVKSVKTADMFAKCGMNMRSHFDQNLLKKTPPKSAKTMIMISLPRLVIAWCASDFTSTHSNPSFHCASL